MNHHIARYGERDLQLSLLVRNIIIIREASFGLSVQYFAFSLVKLDKNEGIVPYKVEIIMGIRVLPWTLLWTLK